MAAQGNTSAQVALDLANEPETFLATVQMGMTLVGIFRGAFGERTLSIRIENIVGVAKEKDLLTGCMSAGPLNLFDAAQPALFVPGAIPAFRLLELFKKSRTHVTRRRNDNAVQRPDGSWLIDGKMPIHDFKELLNLGELPGEERGSYLTLGGFVMMQIGRVPVAADSFDAAGLRFEVVDMDGKRVDKVLAQPLPASDSESREAPGHEPAS